MKINGIILLRTHRKISGTGKYQERARCPFHLFENRRNYITPNPPENIRNGQISGTGKMPIPLV
ncbi:MAG: hypothetical protein F6K39_33940 [Okeania sp. SIO3B3]|nr:hypothetical protein [Okeania sp. SIO3B3]